MSSSSPPPPPPPPPPPAGSPPPPPPPPSGGPPPPPPPPPPSGSPPPPPPPPPPSSSVTSSNYFFGFIITFVILLLLFIGCGLGSWRRFRLIGTAWDAQLQDMEGNPFTVRKRTRRRLVRPTFQERWTSPTTLAVHLASGKWEGVQPISAALLWSQSTLAGDMARRKSRADASTASASHIPREEAADGSVVAHGVAELLRAHMFPRHPRYELPTKPPLVRRPPPEAIQVAVMIAMPFQPSTVSGQMTDRPSFVGQMGVGEYQIGVIRIPWHSGEGT